MTDSVTRAVKRLDEDFEEVMARITAPVVLAEASGEWISAREAKALVERVTGLAEAQAIAAICRRAVICVAVRASTYSRGEDPHEYIDRLDFFADRKTDLSHFLRTLTQSAFGEMLDFFKLIGNAGWDHGNGVEYAIWEMGDFKVKIEKDFSDVTFTVVGLQFDRLELHRSLGEGPQVFETGAVAVPVNAGGRPARRHGEAIAAVTLRLARASLSDLSSYTAEAVGAELATEYERLGERPPHVANLATFGAGILKTLRASQTD